MGDVTMKVVPIKYTFDMINDQALMRMSKSMDSLNSIVVSFSERITEWTQKLNELHKQIVDLNIDEKHEYLNDISIRQDNLVNKYNDWIREVIQAIQVVDDVKSLLTNGRNLSDINPTSDDISNLKEYCIIEKIKILYNKLNAIANEVDPSRIDYFKELPVVDDSGQMGNGSHGNPGQDIPFNENILACIVSTEYEGNIMCAGRFAQMLFSKFGVKQDNVKFSILSMEPGQHVIASEYNQVQVSYALSNDYVGDSISNEHVPQNGMAFICVQGVKSHIKINEIIEKINNLENVPIFLLLDGPIESEEKLNQITTSNPCLIWHSKHSVVSDQNMHYANGGYLMNLMMSLLSYTPPEKCSRITYQSMFDGIQVKYNGIQKQNLNNFNEALPIFTI